MGKAIYILIIILLASFIGELGVDCIAITQLHSRKSIEWVDDTTSENNQEEDNKGEEMEESLKIDDYIPQDFLIINMFDFYFTHQARGFANVNLRYMERLSAIPELPPEHI